MKPLRCLVLFLLVINWPNSALASDRPLTKQEIENSFVGNRYGYSGLGDKASLKSNGQYELLLYDGYSARGTYSVEEDGRICITLPTISYCEQIFIESDGTYHLLDRNAKRKRIEILK